MDQLKYKVACYARISRDEDQKNYDTIISQKNICIDYANTNFSPISIEMYEDDNISGYTMDRPDFNRLQKDIDEGKINCIVSKDLSRIGRNNPQVLMFIQNMQQKDIRVIAINDRFDSTQDDDGMLGIKTWFNERYVQDISKKIKSNIRSKQKNGTYVTAAVPFGYKRSPINKLKVIIDEDVAWVVKKIFELYLSGYGYRKIAIELTETGAPTPSQIIKNQKEQEGIVYKKDVTDEWSPTMIMRMIRNDFYIGTLRQNKQKRKTINGKHFKTDPEEHFVFENNHEPIVSKEDFELAQTMTKRRNVSNYRGGGNKHNNLFSGFMYCADCGSYMTALNKEGKNKSYICGKYNRIGKSGCTTHYVLDRDLKLDLRTFLKRTRNKLQEHLASLSNDISKKKKTNDNIGTKLKKLQKDQKQLNDELKVMLTQKIRDIAKSPDMAEIISQTYDELEIEKKKKLTTVNEEINKLNELVAEQGKMEENINTAIQIYDTLINKEEWEKRDLELIVEKIIIEQDGNPQIYLKDSIDEFI